MSVMDIYKEIYARISDYDTEDIVDDFRAHHLDINYQDEKGISPLMLAAFCGLFDPVECFLKEGAKLDLVDQEGNSALHHSVLPYDSGSSPSSTTVDLLLKAGANCEVKNNEGLTPLAIATATLLKGRYEEDSPESVHALILAGSNTDVSFDEKRSILDALIDFHQEHPEFFEDCLSFKDFLKAAAQKRELLSSTPPQHKSYSTSRF